MTAFLKALLDKLITILLTAAGFLGFVAVVGGISVWFGFYTAGLPAVQAVDAMPRSELLVHGAVPLVLFGVLGVVAVAACYAIDRGARPREGMLHSLAFLFGAAAAAVVLLAPVDTENDVWLAIAISGGLLATVILAHVVQTPAGEQQQLEALEGESAADVPHRYSTTGANALRLLGLGVLLCLLVYELTRQWWAVFAIVAAGGLALINFRIAEGTKNQFAPFAVAVFFSLPLFGMIVNLLVLAEQPLLQPAALIRVTDEGRQVVQGVYVAETDSRIYLGSVATEGCSSSRIRPGSGIIFSIPKTEVTALQIGRRQPILDAHQTAAAQVASLVGTAGTFPDRPKTSIGQPAGSQGGKQQTNKQTQPRWPLRLSRDQAVRLEPIVTSIVPPKQSAGKRININGTGFGEHEGRVLVGSRKARVLNWDDTQIKAVVPQKATTARVRVVCPSAVPTVTVPSR